MIAFLILVAVALAAAVSFVLLGHRFAGANKDNTVPGQAGSSLPVEQSPPLRSDWFSPEEFAAEAEASGLLGSERLPAVLVVDDQTAIRTMLAELFAAQGCPAREASNGRAAIELYRESPADYVLLDLSMPDMDGIEVLREIRDLGGDTEVILMTAAGDPRQLQEAKRLGVLCVMAKPFDFVRFRGQLMQHWNRRSIVQEEGSPWARGNG